MGKLTKLLAKAEQLAGKELEKLLTSQGGNGQQQQQQAYMPPTVVNSGVQHAQPAGFSTPPPSPPHYHSGLAMGVQPGAYRPGTPPMQVAQQQQQQAYAPPSVQPQQYLAPTTLSPSPSGRGRKKAVLIACSYPGTRSMLRGPANDALCMQHLLKKLGWTDSGIILLRDDDVSRGAHYVPTRDVIFRALGWMMSDLRPGDSLFVHFSGHGSRLRDPTGEEADGYDETILPTDFKRAGQIRDTELARLLCHPLPTGVTLHALFDSCHSGTMLDLPYETKYDRRTGQAFWKRSNMRGSAGGLVVQVGACEDTHTAADTAALSQTAYTGAATYAFIDAIEHYGLQQSYGQLLLHITEALRKLGKTSRTPPSAASSAVGASMPLAMGLALGPAGILAGALLGQSIASGKASAQTPVLCSDRAFDLATSLQL